MSTLIQRANGTIIYFDTAETVVKNFPNKVTMHPIEDGSPITDHVISEPRKVSVTGLISDAAFLFEDDDPFTEIRTLDDGTTRRVPISGRSLQGLAELEAIRDNRELFQLETRDEVFTNMVFTEFRVPRDADTGQAARVVFTAQQIETVERRFTSVPAAAESDADKAAEEAETGKQATNALSDASAAIQGSAFLIRQLNGPDADVDSVLDSVFGANP